MIGETGLRSLSFEDWDRVHDYSYDIINNLDAKSINELFSGYEQDIDTLYSDMEEVINEIVNHNFISSPNNYKFQSLNHFEQNFEESLRILSYNYFKTVCLPNFTQGYRNIEWGNMVQLYPWVGFLCQRGSGKSYEFCYAWPLWRLYSYRRPNFLEADTIQNKNRRDTIIITNESRLGMLHLGKITDEIRINDILGEKLLNKELGKEKVQTRNGGTIALRTFGSFIRGLHVGGVVVDDFLDKSCLYSNEQREKFHEVFYAEIVNIVEPGGNLIVSGTPFHLKDLYNDLKEDPNFLMFEYPGIFPDGKILATDRYDYEDLMKRKVSLGSIVFAREHLVTPLNDDSSLFPWDYLRNAFIGMENISLVENIESYPIKLERVIVGCDFAISGNVSADYCVFSVWGADKNQNMYLLHVWRKKGASHLEQVSNIMRLDRNFRPNEIQIENNGFQRIMGDLAKERGLKNIKEFTTTAKIKKDLYEGLPSLSAMFERGQIKIPFKEGKSKETAEWLCGEFNSITINEDSGKLESSDQHDDGVMSSFIAITKLREEKSNFKVSFV